MHIRGVTVADAGSITRVHVDSPRSACRGIMLDDYLDGILREEWGRRHE